jgi:hypothetical protein
MKRVSFAQFQSSDNIQNSITEALYTCGSDVIAASMVTASIVAIIFTGPMLQHKIKICPPSLCSLVLILHKIYLFFKGNYSNALWEKQRDV